MTTENNKNKWGACVDRNGSVIKMPIEKIESTADAWETGQLGQDEAFVEVSKDIDQKMIDESLDLQMISIRLQKSLIEDLKMIAKLNGLGYQPLARQILTRFVEGEKKQLLKQHYQQVKDAEASADWTDDEPRKAG